MKKAYTFIILASCMLSVSCNKSLDIPCESIDSKDEHEQKTFVAQFDTPVTIDPSTRTALGSDGLAVSWTLGDKISIVASDGVSFSDYTLKDTDAGKQAGNFTGYSPANSNSGFFGVYPNKSSYSLSGNVISGLVVPAHQHAVKGSFDPAAAVMTSYTENNTMVFKHACSFVRIEVGDDMNYLMRITLESIKNDKTPGGREIAGTFDATVNKSGDDQSVCAISNVTSASTKIILEPSSGDVIEPGVYYIAVLPGSLDYGFEVRFETVLKSYMRRLAKKKDLNRAVINNLGKFLDTNPWTWTEEKPQEVLYSGSFSSNGVNSMHFSTGNLQAVFDGSGYTFRLAPEQFEYVGDATTTGNYKLAKSQTLSNGDTVDMFAWTQNGMYTDGVKQYGITNVTGNGSSPNWNLYNNDASSLEVCDWAGKYKTDSGSSREWRMMTVAEWRYVLYENTKAKSAVKCTITLPSGSTVAGQSTVTGYWIHPDGSNKWDSSAPSTISDMNDFYTWVAKGCMFLPIYGFMLGSNTVSATEKSKGYYWTSEAKSTGATGKNNKWNPYAAVTPSSYLDQGAARRCFVRLVTNELVD